MISLLLDGVNLGFEKAESVAGDTIHILVVVDEQSGITIRLPLDPAAARAITAHLDGRPVIETARSIPKT